MKSLFLCGRCIYTAPAIFSLSEDQYESENWPLISEIPFVTKKKLHYYKKQQIELVTGYTAKLGVTVLWFPRMW